MRGLLAIILIVIGVLALVAGILYLTQPAHSLPTFFPGYAAHSLVKHTKRGIGGVVVGAVLLAIGVVVATVGGRRRRH